MLVTFHSPSYADITMFGEIAIKLLKLMGLSGRVPSAILAEDIPKALARLKQAIKEAEAKEEASEEEEEKSAKGACENRVSLVHRALPLIELLEASVANDSDVMWD